MDDIFTRQGSRLIAQLYGEALWLEPVGPDSVRVRATRNAAIDESAISALIPGPVDWQGQITVGEQVAELSQGRLCVEARVEQRVLGPAIMLRFLDAGTRAVLLEEEAPHFMWPDARHYSAQEGDLWHVETRFAAQDGERFYGLGQHQHGRLDQKGCVVELLQANTEVVIPFLVSSRGYGVIWNNPGVGQVELAANATRWVMQATAQIDYVVTAGESPKELIDHYTVLTGRPPVLPEWAAGFWQCKLRYDTQEKVLAVAREYHRRGLPLDVIVIDFFHWTRMGEWRFDPDDFPDPKAMVDELHAMGVTPMVSIWPTVNANAETFTEMKRAGFLVDSRQGLMDGLVFFDRQPKGRNPIFYYDATHPKARAYHWQRVKDGYVTAGFKAFWLDADEPEMYPMTPGNLRYHAGDGRAVTNAYPLLHQQGYADHMAAEGIADGLMLSRSAWLGSQRYPVVVWSGDVRSTFPDLARQVRAGLNMALSGLPWWTTDIGGFKNGDIADPGFQELIVRWFQYGAFCPIFRLHGFRNDSSQAIAPSPDWRSGADNEVWSFGETAYEILTFYLHLRERLKPYIMAQMQTAHDSGTPPMRPLLLEFPGDEAAWDVDDQFLLGPDLLVAPVLSAGAAQRSVYLPSGEGARGEGEPGEGEPGETWRDAWSDTRYSGGQSVTVEAPLGRIPLFLRGQADLPIRG